MNSTTCTIERRDRKTIEAFLIANGLAAPDEKLELYRLTGGVSSDIWLVEIGARSICVKRALEKLRVAADWHAPVDRNAYEWAWLQFASRHCPDSVPLPLAHDLEAGLFAMSYLEPTLYPVWKEQLLAGHIEVLTASKVGDVLGSLHAASARNAAIEHAFDSTENFYQLRLEPYFNAAARCNESVAPVLHMLVERTRNTRMALVHGDVSPKNILVGPDGPVFLDAECAWYGDPAFDLAFCLNHLLLKSVNRPSASDLLTKAYESLAESYLARVSWEDRSALEQRAATLLPALILARIDGKSPVEYIKDQVTCAFVRAIAISLLESPVKDLSAVSILWNREFKAHYRNESGTKRRV